MAFLWVLVVLAVALHGAVAAPSQLTYPLQALVETWIFDDLGNALEQGQVADLQWESMVADLEYSFAALPQKRPGAVSAEVGRYVLFRFFNRQGLHMKDWAPSGGSRASAALVAPLARQVPREVLRVLEERFDTRGVEIKELALLSAIVQSLIQGEAAHRLEAMYKILGKDTEELLSEDDTSYLLDAYTAVYVMGMNVSDLSKADVEDLLGHIGAGFLYWDQAQELLRDIQQEFCAGLVALKFSDVAAAVVAFTERYAYHQNTECHDVLDRLVKLEGANGTGRVKLHDFYASYTADENWQFFERLDYLEQVGAIDNSDPSSPHLIIPNYVNSHANCLSTDSHFYDLCCSGRCEGIMEVIESGIQGPTATPEQILEIIMLIVSSPMRSDETLASVLVPKLEEVAKYHGGVVPLHGRLFAQWMHFAFPQECVYPHVSGTAKVMSDTAWAKATNTSHRFSDEEIESYVESAAVLASASSSDLQTVLQAAWLMEEELLDAAHFGSANDLALQRPAANHFSRTMIRLIAFFTLVAASGVTMYTYIVQHATTSSLTSGDEPSKPKYRHPLRCASEATRPTAAT